MFPDSGLFHGRMHLPSFNPALAVSIRGYGAVADGATDCRAAVLAAAATGKPILFDGGDFWIASDTSIEVPVCFEPGSRVSGPATAKFAMQGGVIAGEYQIFHGDLKLECYRPTVARAEWFGALTGRGDFDSAPFISKALTVFPVVHLLPGIYYCSAPIKVGSQSLIGAGRSRTLLYNNSSTNHIIDASGVRATSAGGPSYIERPTIARLSGVRTAVPSTPASAADDVGQGHGLHMDMASNLIVEEVDMTNNLIDFYFANTLSAYWNNSLSIMNSGGAGDRRTSFYIDGQAAGGSFPPNLVFRAKEIRQSNQSGAGATYGLVMRGSFTDHDIERLETAGCHESLWLDGTGANVHIRSAWLDGFKANGVRIDGSGYGSNVTFLDLYAVPGAGATGTCIVGNSTGNIHFVGTQIASFPGGGVGKAGAVFNSSVDCVVQGVVMNHSTGVTLNNCYGCTVDVSVTQFSGAANEAIKVSGGYANKLAPTIVGVPGGVGYSTGVTLLATGACSVDLTRVLDSAVGKRLTLDGTTYNGAGNIPGGNFVVRPGAAINTAAS